MEATHPMTLPTGYQATSEVHSTDAGGFFAPGGPAGPAPADGAGGQLVTITNKDVTQVRGGAAASNQTVAERTRSLRDARYAARSVLNIFSSLKRIRGCGAVGIRPAGTVDVLRGADGASFSGVGTCGSVWACPVCSAKIQARRRSELEQLVDRCEAEGKTVLFGTMTLRHREGQSLGQLWGTLGECYKAVREDRTVRDLRKRLGFFGYVRAVEVTHGENGWHPHIHMIYIFDGPVTEAQMMALGDAEFAVWQRTAVRAGLGEPLRERYDLQKVMGWVSDYLAKTVYETPKSAASVGFEMSGAMTKEAYRGGRTPFQILGDFVTGREAPDLELWHEYEQVSRGKRALTWSRGLKAWAGIDDVSDEEIAAEDDDLGEDAAPLFTIADWHRDLGWGRSWLGSRLLSTVERAPTWEKALRDGLAFCAEHGIETLAADDPLAVYDRLAHRRWFNRDVASGTARLEHDPAFRSQVAQEQAERLAATGDVVEDAIRRQRERVREASAALRRETDFFIPSELLPADEREGAIADREAAIVTHRKALALEQRRLARLVGADEEEA